LQVTCQASLTVPTFADEMQKACRHCATFARANSKHIYERALIPRPEDETATVTFVRFEGRTFAATDLPPKSGGTFTKGSRQVQMPVQPNAGRTRVKLSPCTPRPADDPRQLRGEIDAPNSFRAHLCRETRKGACLR
jgi:hypothetical protein